MVHSFWFRFERGKHGVELIVYDEQLGNRCFWIGQNDNAEELAQDGGKYIATMKKKTMNNEHGMEITSTRLPIGGFGKCFLPIGELHSLLLSCGNQTEALEAKGLHFFVTHVGNSELPVAVKAFQGFKVRTDLVQMTIVPEASTEVLGVSPTPRQK
ncbi:hypothetical protein HY213_01085 [Candidatus Peregrinibacteria bacterium]|nr:hypothetical protein [Candidatus Peregrinibacteria bacterium]